MSSLRLLRRLLRKREQTDIGPYRVPACILCEHFGQQSPCRDCCGIRATGKNYFTKKGERND